MATILGTSEPDFLRGDTDDDVLSGGTNLSPGTSEQNTGDDRLFGGQGSDTLLGGDGNDALGGFIEDGTTLLFEEGDDQIYGHDGDDLLDGSLGDDDLFGGNGQDTILGGSGNDNLLGENGNDILDGGSGNDTIDGGSGTDRAGYFTSFGSFEIISGASTEVRVFNAENTLAYTIEVDNTLPGLTDPESPDYLRVTVTDELTSGDNFNSGVDTLVSVEFIDFSGEEGSDSGSLNLRNIINEAAPDNTPPNVVTNTGLEIAESATSRIFNTSLETSDLDEDPLTYTITSLPTQGTLFLDTDTTSSTPSRIVFDEGDTVLTVGDTFTQEDINEGLLGFDAPDVVQTSDPFSLDSIGFSVSDGQASTTGDFEITLNPVNDPLNLTVNTFSAQEGISTALRQTALNATDEESRPSAITYTLSSLPDQGELFLSGNELSVDDTFTQADVNAGRLRYQHDGSEPDGTSTPETSFDFTVEVNGEESQDGTLQINVAPVNDIPNLTVQSFDVIGTEETVIATENLEITDPDNSADELTYILQDAPRFGDILGGTTDGEGNLTFTQADIDNGSISYQKTDTETDANFDTITFRISDGTFTSPNTTGLRFSLTDPLTEVVNTGSETRRLFTDVITQDELEYESSADPEDIIYTASNLTLGVLSLAGGGAIFSFSNPNATVSFSQDDINNGLVKLGAIANDSGSFEFDVTDGQTTIEDQTFNFDFLPLFG